MAVDTRNLPSYFNSDADFRSWGSGIAAQLAAVGLVQTADTGQINWTTVLTPSAASQVRGYEIWRFADTLQATNPLFIKIEYGSAATGVGGALTPSLWFTVGPASNGSGTIVASGAIGVGTRTAVSARGQTSAGNTKPSYASASMAATACGGRFMLATNIDTGASSFGIAFLLERTRGGDGVPTADGAISFAVSGGSSGQESHFYQFLPGNATPPTQVNFAASASGGIFPALQTTGGGQGGPNGAAVAFSPLIAFYGKPLYGTSCGYSSADLSAFSTSVSATHFGATHNFITFGSFALGGGYFGNGPSSGNNNAQRLACLYE